MKFVQRFSNVGTKDSSMADEIEWGFHTNEILFVEYQDITYRSTVVLSDDSLCLLFTQKMKKSKLNRYQIFLNQIQGIRVKTIDELQDQIPSKKTNKDNSIVYHNDISSEFGTYFKFTLDMTNKEEITFYCKDSSQMYKRIQETLINQKLRDVTMLGQLKSDTDINLTVQYYTDTLQALQSTRHTSTLTEVLDEFAHEIIINLRLKDVIFRSKELLLTLQLICSKAVQYHKQQHHKQYQKHRKSTSISSSVYSESDMSTSILFSESMNEHRNLNIKRSADLIDADWNDRSGGSNSLRLLGDAEKEEERRGLVLKRMLLLQSVLKVLSALLFSSDCMELRFGMFSGPSPLDVDTWLPLLVTDLYRLLNIRFDVEDTIDSHLVAEEIERSIHEPSPGSRFAAGGTVHGSFTQAMLTPLRDRVTSQLRYLNRQHPFLLQIRQRLRDVQLLTLSSITHILHIGGDPHSMGRVPPLGLTLARQPEISVFLEDIVIRVSSTLEDMLGSEEVVTHLRRQSMDQPKSPVHGHGQGQGHGYTSTGRKLSVSFSASPGPLSLSAGTPGGFAALVRRDSVISAPPTPTPTKLSSLRGIRFLRGGGGSGPGSCSILETREILLFSSSWVLKYLALDSYKIRQIMIEDLEEYWTGIMTVFNILCPRPAIITHNNNNKPTVSKSTSTVSKSNHSSNILKYEATTTSAIKSMKFIAPKVYERDFGPARYGQSPTVWSLVVQARMCIEEVCIALDLDHNLLYRAVPMDFNTITMTNNTDSSSSIQQEDKSLRLSSFDRNRDKNPGGVNSNNNSNSNSLRVSFAPNDPEVNGHGHGTGENTPILKLPPRDPKKVGDILRTASKEVHEDLDDDVDALIASIRATRIEMETGRGSGGGSGGASLHPPRRSSSPELSD
eukprot:gene2334-4538_t